MIFEMTTPRGHEQSGPWTFFVVEPREAVCTMSLCFWTSMGWSGELAHSELGVPF